MMLASLWHLAILASHASALAFRGPRATPQAETGHLVFPPEPTAAPKVHADLFRRQNVMTDLIAPDNTCGFISGLAGAAYYCNPDTEICAFFPGTSTTYGFIGCCDPVNFACGARLTCIDSVQYYSSSACDNGCEKDTFTLKCTASTAPYCNGVQFPNEGVEDYFCDGTQVTSWQTAYTTYSLEDDGRVFSPLTVTLTSAEPTSGTTGIPLTITPVSSSGAPPQSSSNPSGSQGAAGPAAGGTSASPTTSGPVGPTTSAAPAASSSGTPIGAIVGGVVGGVAGIAIIALVVFFVLRSMKKKDNAANTSNGAPPPTYLPPQDPNNPAYVAANADKPGLTTQETALPGHWAPGQNQYPPQMVEQQQYPPQMQQHQYPPQDQQYPQQQYSSQMQQQPPHPNMAEVQGSYGQYPPQNMDPAHDSQSPTPNPHYSMISSVTQPSPNPQARLSAAFPDRGDTTSPLSTHQVSELSTPGGAQAPLSPSPTVVSNMGAPAHTPEHVAPVVEGRAEMSANMAGGPFPINVYEVPGSEVYNH